MGSGIRTLLLVSLACVSGAATDSLASRRENAPSAAHVPARRLTVAGIPNLGEVTPMLYRGARPSQLGLAKLADMNVSIVVDLRPASESEARAVHKLGMHYVSIPWHCPFPRDESFAKLLKLIRHHRDKKIFVHCRLGDDRTGMAIAAYRMSEENWTAEEAMKEMEAFGFTMFHRAICPGLAEYEGSFPERLKHSAAFRSLRK